MQKQLANEHPTLSITIIGVNEAGHESGNSSITGGRDLPWLQDTDESAWWDTWDIEYRDVVILDAAGERIETFNLSENNLGDQANFDALSSSLISAAQPG